MASDESEQSKSRLAQIVLRLIYLNTSRQDVTLGDSVRVRVRVTPMR